MKKLTLFIIILTLIICTAFPSPTTAKLDKKEWKSKPDKKTKPIKIIDKKKIDKSIPPLSDSCLILGRMKDWATDPRLNKWIYDPNAPKTSAYPGSKQDYYARIDNFPGTQEVSFCDLFFKKDNLNLRRVFIAAGEKTYETGTMCGNYIRRGYMNGDETGVWCPPYKMLDGVFIEIREKRDKSPKMLYNAYKFKNHFAYMELFFKKNNLSIIRKDFAPVSEYAFYYSVKIQNTYNSKKNQFTFRFGFQENIRPQFGKHNKASFGEDQIIAESENIFIAYDKYIKDVKIAFGAINKPDKRYIDRKNPFRNRGIFEYNISLGPGEKKEYQFLVCMYDKKKMLGPANTSKATNVEEYCKELKTNYQELLDEKIVLYREKIIYGPRIECPDKNIQNAFLCTKWSLQTLNLDIRPYHPQRFIMTAPTHGYAIMFGIDPLYCSIGSTVAGFSDIAKDTYLNMLHFAKNYDYTGIPFTVNQWGKATDTFGRAQENMQYIATIWEHVKITGDKKFAEFIYPCLKKMFQAQRKILDTDKDFWLEGMAFPGETESVRFMSLTGEIPSKKGSEKAELIKKLPPEYQMWKGKGVKTPEGTADVEMISAGVRICWAARNMGAMAEALGKEDDAKKYNDLYQEMKKKFNQEWWLPDKKIWATGLANYKIGAKKILLPEVKKSHIYPQAYKIADWEKGRTANKTFLKLSHRTDSEGTLAMTWGAGMLALALYFYEQPKTGFNNIKSMAWVATEYDHMLGALPLQVSREKDSNKSSGKMLYSWSTGPVAESIVRGMYGIEANAFTRTINFKPQLPPAWKKAKFVDYIMGEYSEQGPNYIDFIYENGKWEVLNKKGSSAININYIRGKEKTTIKILPNKNEFLK